MNIHDVHICSSFVNKQIKFYDESDVEYLVSIVSKGGKKCTNICVTRDPRAAIFTPSGKRIYFYLASVCPQELSFNQCIDLVLSCTSIEELKEKLFLI